MYHFKAAATFAVLALLGLASAECNKTGMQASKETMDAARQDAQLETVCSALTGTYHLREKRGVCLEIGGNKYDFELKYDAKSGWFTSPAETRNIGLAECKNGMNKELGCSRGGKTMYTNWWYRADYNLGKCTQPVRRSNDPEAEVIRRDHRREFTG
ncbi:hypothetical protein BKA66DRAFT_576534 [Pyrenochaeta sp. MPI-SDFR-AT-0127]|nr:hypothetical protein BKA66DRAFT_576534 [Pyrenochaeta sp. MPI-SDFR-AT-0127]